MPHWDRSISSWRWRLGWDVCYVTLKYEVSTLSWATKVTKQEMRHSPLEPFGVNDCGHIRKASIAHKKPNTAN